jgi:hypothetical protein
MVPPEEKNDVIVDARTGAIALQPIRCAKNAAHPFARQNNAFAAQTNLIAAL